MFVVVFLCCCCCRRCLSMNMNEGPAFFRLKAVGCSVPLMVQKYNGFQLRLVVHSTRLDSCCRDSLHLCTSPIVQ